LWCLSCSESTAEAAKDVEVGRRTKVVTDSNEDEEAEILENLNKQPTRSGRVPKRVDLYKSEENREKKILGKRPKKPKLTTTTSSEQNGDVVAAESDSVVSKCTENDAASTEMVEGPQVPIETENVDTVRENPAEAMEVEEEATMQAQDITEPVLPQEKSPVSSEQTVQKSPVRPVQTSDKSPVRPIQTYERSPAKSVPSPQKSPMQLFQNSPKSPVRPVHISPKSPVRPVHNSPKSPVRAVHNSPKSPVRAVQNSPKSPVQTVQSSPKSPVQTVQSSKSPVQPVQTSPKSPVRLVQKSPKSPARRLETPDINPVQYSQEGPVQSVPSPTKSPAQSKQNSPRRTATEKSIDLQPENQSSPQIICIEMEDSAMTSQSEGNSEVEIIDLDLGMDFTNSTLEESPLNISDPEPLITNWDTPLLESPGFNKAVLQKQDRVKYSPYKSILKPRANQLTDKNANSNTLTLSSVDKTPPKNSGVNQTVSEGFSTPPQQKSNAANSGSRTPGQVISVSSLSNAPNVDVDQIQPGQLVFVKSNTDADENGQSVIHVYLVSPTGGIQSGTAQIGQYNSASSTAKSSIDLSNTTVSETDQNTSIIIVPSTPENSPTTKVTTEKGSSRSNTIVISENNESDIIEIVEMPEETRTS
jgi:hypothetical protein